MTCVHLRPIEDWLLADGARVVFRGQAWSRASREWVYVDRALEPTELRQRFALAPCVVEHRNDDPRSGRERGLYCTACHDAVMGEASPLR
jgi:hypothetical protein